MPKFENESWKVEEQFEDITWKMTAEEIARLGYRGEAETPVGYLLVAETEDGERSEIVTTHGILASERDLEITALFAASNDLYNAAEAVLPLLRSLVPTDLEAHEQAAVDALEAALLKADAPDILRDERNEHAAGRRP